MKTLCIYCGSHFGASPIYREATVDLANKLVKENITLVYGGASVGLMGLIADTVIQNGGRAIGVIPEGLFEKEIAHEGLSELYTVRSMHERKAKMAELSEGFVALPGGLGTYEELFETLTWAQLGLHRKPIAVLNTHQFFKPLFDLLDHSVEQGFIRKENRELLLSGDNADEVLAKLKGFVPVARQWQVEVKP